MATEKRLIDANALEEFLADAYGYQAVDILGDLAKFPTVDAVEVVHGQWVWNEENQCWICSVCELSALNDYRGNPAFSEYCSHCGAQMDGGADT